MLKLAIFSLFALHGTVWTQEGNCTQVCRSCNNETKSCYECIQGYYLEPIKDLTPLQGSCIPCSPNCLTCENDTNCTQCSQGYTSDSTVCVACNKGCSDCYLSPSNCTGCIADYTLEHESCTYLYNMEIIIGVVLGLVTFCGLCLFCGCVLTRKDDPKPIVESDNKKLDKTTTTLTLSQELYGNRDKIDNFKEQLIPIDTNHNNPNDYTFGDERKSEQKNKTK